MTAAAEIDGAAVRDPGAMTEAELREEVWFWRTEAASGLFFLTVEARAAMEKDPEGTETFQLRDRVRQRREALISALTGDLFDSCDVCTDPILWGAACLRDVEMGDVHAECMGAPMPGAGPIAPGDKVQCDPEGIVGPDDEPIPDSDGILIAYAHDRLYTTPQILKRLDEAAALLYADEADGGAQ